MPRSGIYRAGRSPAYRAREARISCAAGAIHATQLQFMPHSGKSCRKAIHARSAIHVPKAQFMRAAQFMQAQPAIHLTLAQPIFCGLIRPSPTLKASATARLPPVGKANASVRSG